VLWILAATSATARSGTDSIFNQFYDMLKQLDIRPAESSSSAALKPDYQKLPVVERMISPTHTAIRLLFWIAGSVHR